jgi:hypothetical protein
MIKRSDKPLLAIVGKEKVMIAEVEHRTSPQKIAAYAFC